MIIDFSELTQGKVRNLSGHERGAEARGYFDLNSLDETTEVVEVVVPDNLDAIATSFFQGMFARSVRKFRSEEEFLSHYRFAARPEIISQVMRGIERVKMERGSAFLH
ncbi:MULTISPECIES: hypothetical protein [Phaeobacter]|uniref:hypothetical protein n=1 Tax=Phaeobacter TaxID=302485 RepID=UPI00058FCD63|nr:MULTISPECIES: hypothetical protein [Phaeobacter]KII14128.1 hypothetical protein OO25_13985 [Phaeobacter sp. S60]UTS80949.1 hypothetical protein OL67_002020 [Phaeobacter piscinae]